MKRYAAAVLLVLCLILGGCDRREEPETGEYASGRLASAVELTDDAVLLTVDGREVPAWRYLYWLAYTCQQVRERYQMSDMTLDWEAPVSGGTLADYVKEQALADAALYATVENWAARYGCTISEEVSETEPLLPDLGLTEEQMAELEQVGQLYAQLYALYCTEGSALAPSAETLAAYGETVGAVTLEQLLVPFGEDRDAARDQAAQLFSRINSAEDQGAVFSELMTDSGVTAGVKTVTEDTEEPELLAAAQALEEGQCSGILETESGFSIVRRLPLDTSVFREACFDAMLQEAAENAIVTTQPEYVRLDPADVLAALTAEPSSEELEESTPETADVH